MNPLNCTFGVPSDKLLGFVIRDLDINIDQAKVKRFKICPKLRISKSFVVHKDAWYTLGGSYRTWLVVVTYEERNAL